MKVALLVKKSQVELAGDKPSDRLHHLLAKGDPTVAHVMASHEEHVGTVAEVKAALAGAGASVWQGRCRGRRRRYM